MDNRNILVLGINDDHDARAILVLDGKTIMHCMKKDQITLKVL